MPNWVFNTMSVTGSPEALADFKKKANAREREISYWNFVTPPQEALDSGEYEATNGWSKENGHEGDTPNNWYNFNNREWGTKWDCSSAEIVTEDEGEITYSWTSPWSPPIPVFEAMAKQHPKLAFDFEWEEEQGWGGAARGSNGFFGITSEYDTPDSHADYEARGRSENCNCKWSDDQDDWYDDCPRPKNELADKIKQQIIAKTGVSQEWASKHLEVII